MAFSVNDLSKALNNKKKNVEQPAQNQQPASANMPAVKKPALSGSSFSADDLNAAIQDRKKSVQTPVFQRVRTEAAQNVDPRAILSDAAASMDYGDGPSYFSRRMNDMGIDSSEDPEKYRDVFRPVMAIGSAVPTWVASKAENIRLGNEWALEHAPDGTSISDYALEQYRAGNLDGAAKAAVENYLNKQQQAKDSVETLKDFADRWTGYGQSGMEYATEGLDTDKVSGKLANWSLQGLNSVTQNLMDVGAAKALGIGDAVKPVEGASQTVNKARGLFNYIPFAERSFGAAAGEARRADVDLSTQLDYALKNTVKEVATEMMWSTGDIFGVGGFDDLAEKGVKSLVRKSAATGPMRDVLSTAASLGMAFTTEAMEEVVGTLVEEFYLNQILDPNAEPPTGWDLVNKLVESGMVGGLSGMMMGGGNVLSQNLDARINQTRANASEIIEAAKNSGSEEAVALAKKVEASADKGYLTSDLQDLAQMTAEAQYETESKSARAQMEERIRDIQNPYRGMDTEDAAELIRRGNVYGVQGADVANAEDVSAAKLQQIAREVTKAEEATGRSETVRQAVQEAKSGTVSDETAERILNDARATEYFGADVTPNMTEAERSNVVKAAIETVAEAENRAAAERNTSNRATTQSEENVSSTGRFFDTVKETLGESGQAAFTNLMQAPTPAMSPQIMMDRARAAAIIYNAGTNGTAIESIRIQNNPLTATEMSAMYSAGVNDGRQSGIRTGERQNDLAAGERSREISQRARETKARRQGATVQRTAVRAAVENEAAVSPKEIGFRNGSDTKNLKVLPESAYSALNKHDRSAVEQLKKKGFKVVLMVSADGNGIGGLLEDVQGKRYRGAIQDGDTIFLSADHWNYTVEQIARHEYFHSVLESNEGLRSAIVSRLYDQFSAAEILNMQQAYAEDYNWSGVDADYVLDEILCDAFGGMDVFEDKHLFPYHVTDYAEIVREVAKEADGGKAGFELAQRYSQDLSDVTPATRAESLKLDITDKRNVARYVDEITDVLSGTMSAEQLVLIGKPSSVLAEYMKSNKPLYMPQSAVRKAALAKAEGGKHGLGRVVVDELIYQLDDPMAITGNTSRHKAYNDNSIVVWTDWKTTAGDSIIVPIRIDVNGRVGIYNNVNTLFDVYDQGYINDLLRSENILYTRQEKSIVELLEQRRDMPELKSDNASTDTIAQSPEDGNNKSFRGSEEQMSFIDMTENQIKLKLQDDFGMDQKDAAYNAETVADIGDINIEGTTFNGKPAGRTLAVAFREELIQDGRTSLIGKQVRNAKDLATLAQVYRNPRFETMRYFFINDSGEVVYHTGVSSGLVSSSAVAPSNAFLLKAIREAKAAGATGAYVLHNHPSGDPTPSDADISVQKVIDDYFSRHDLQSHGGVIINSNRYASYGGGQRTATRPLGSGVDELLSPAGRTELVGMTVTNTGDFANLGKAIQLSPDYSAVIYLGAKLNVVAVQEVHNDIAADEVAMSEWIENNLGKYGAERCAIVTGDDYCYHIAMSLMKDGVSLDAVHTQFRHTAVDGGGRSGSYLGSRSAAAQEVRFSEESLKKGVSETKDLMAIHNLTYDNIRASIKLGGLPSPSIAVVKAETGHTKYGPVSFVFSKDTIDPKKNRKNRIYGADAWTPTAADARTEYPINTKEFNKAERRLAELSQQIADGAFYNTSILSGLYSYGYSDDSLDRMAERVARREGAKAAFAAATGKTVDVVYKDQVYSKQFGNASLQKFTDKVGAQRLAEIEANLIEGMPVEEAAGDDIETIRNIMREYYADRDAAFYNKIARVKGLSESEKQATIKAGVDKSMEKNVHDWTIEDFIHMAWAMYEDGGAPGKVVDRYATEDNLVKVAPEEDVKSWLLKELDGVLGEPGIYNGADPYNRDGSRKTFKQTHWAYTLANIVKAMNNASSRGQRAMATASGLQSVAAEEFGSIEAMREKRGRLGKVEDEAYEARTKAVEDQISAVMDDIAGKDYYFRDIAEEVLMQAATGPKSAEGIMRTFAREDIDISRDVAQKIRELFLAAAELPTEYFEAKPQRAVGLDEVLAAVVPTDAPADVVDGLRSEGVNVLTYEAGNDADRVAKMNSVDNARFSEEKASDGSTLSPAQIAFFKNSTARDENGRLQVLYHGTKKGGFTVFKGWSYLTADRSYAERYSRGGESEALYKVFANITKPFDTRLPEVRDIWQNEFFGNYSRTPLQDRGLPDWTDGYDLAEWIEEEGLDYDAILLDEGTDRGISYVIRNSNQIKNVDNLNPTENPDIRYSEEPENVSQRAQQSQDELERLQQDLALSQAEVAYWKQARTTGTHVVNKADVKRVSNDVLKKWDATVKAGEITDRMEELADCLYQGMGIDEVLPLALDIADDICSSARVIADGEAYETYKDIRKYFRENKIKRVDGIGDPGFYKRNFGKIRFAKEGRAVDAMWDDWQSRWGVEFFPDDVVTSQDKVLHLVEVIDSIESLYENPYNRDYAEAVEACAYSLMDDIMSGGVRYEPVMLTSANGRAASEYNRTIAEKNRQIEQLQKEKEDAAAYYREREEQLKAEYKQKGKETAEFYRERAELMRERLERENAETIQHYMEREARAKELLAEVRKRRDERLSELKQHYKEVAMGKKWRRAESDARHRLQRIAKRLQNRKLPAVSRGLLNQYIGDLDTAALSITGKKLDELKDLQAWYTNRKATDPDFIANPDIEKKLARINQKRISELSIDEVVQLTQVLMNIENTINTERQMIDSEDRRDIYAQGLETIGNIQAAKASENKLKDWVITNTLSPVRMIKRLTGYVKTDPLYRAVEALADGQRKMFDYQMQAYRMFDTWASDKAYTKSLQEPMKIQGFRNGVLTEAEITKDMAIALYMHSKNDQNLAHIKDGGITISAMKLKNGHKQGDIRIKMSPAMVKAIESKLSAKDKAYAAAAMKYFNETSPAAINEVSEKLVGYSLAQVENYFPINTDSNFTKKEFESLKMDGTIEGMGFLKERVDAKNPIYLRGFSEVLNQSIEMNSKYVGLAIPVRNFDKLWNVTTADYSDADNVEHFTGSVKEAIAQKWNIKDSKGRNRATYYIEKMMTDLQNANVKSDELDSLLGKVRSNYAGAVLTLNLSVAIKQAASYPTAGAVLGGKALAKALANPKVDPNLIAKYTPLYWYRSQGFADQELGDLKRRNRQIPKLLNWIQAADMATTRTLWKASEYYVRDNNKNLQIGTDAYYQEVARIYNRVIEETQPNYTTMQRPQLLRSDSSMVQSIAMFKTQPFQNFNVLYDAVGEYEALARAKKAGADVDLKQAGKNVRRAVSSQVVQLAVFSAMTFIWNMIRRKHDKYEDEEGEMTAASTFKGIGKDMISGSFSMVPFGSNMYELMDSIINGAQYYGFDSVTITALDDTATAIINQWNLVKDATGTVIEGGTPDWNTFRIKTKKNLNNISKLAGIPVENVNNLYEAAYHWAAIYSEGEYMGEYRYLCLTISPNSSKVKYYALLKKAWLNDQKAFNQLQQEMLDSGYFTEKGINQKIGSWKKEVGQ